MLKRRFLPAFLLLAACAQDAPPAERQPATLSTAPEAAAPAAAVADSAAPVVWVDVRTPEEFATGHVEGAINIPHDQMEARWEELAAYRDQPVALYCRSGRRSGIALEVLQGKGFTRATNEGGFEALAARGVPTAR